MPEGSAECRCTQGPFGNTIASPMIAISRWRTGQANLSHPAPRQDFTPSTTDVVPKRSQAYEPEVPVEVREWIYGGRHERRSS
jgi:hypothetical protein